MLVQEKIEREFADAGWAVDGGFSHHLTLGNSGDLSILAHRRTRGTDDPTYELYDVKRHLSCWVKEVPTPQRAVVLVEEHGETPEEEQGGPTNHE